MGIDYLLLVLLLLSCQMQDLVHSMQQRQRQENRHTTEHSNAKQGDTTLNRAIAGSEALHAKHLCAES